MAVNMGVVCRIFKISGSVGQKREQFFERPPKILLQKKKYPKNIFYFFIFSEIALVVASVDKTGIPKIVLSPPKECYTLSRPHYLGSQYWDRAHWYVKWES